MECAYGPDENGSGVYSGYTSKQKPKATAKVKETNTPSFLIISRPTWQCKNPKFRYRTRLTTHERPRGKCVRPS